MGKRVKKVFTNHEQVLHLWANQSQESARCKNVFFTENKCYSYGWHYELGRIIEFNGVKVAMINARGYSVTTSKHISSAYWACKNLMPVFKVSGVDQLDNVIKGVLNRQSELVDEFFSIFKSRPGRYERWGVRTLIDKEDSEYGLYAEIKRFNQHVKQIGLSEYALNLDQFNIDLYDEAGAYLSELYKQKNTPEAIAEKELRAQKRAELELKKNATKVAAWRAGTSNSTGLDRGGYALIRVKGDLLETSHGAQVPLPDAVKLYAAIKAGKSKPGAKVGSFALTRADNDVIRIGCHTFAMSEADLVLGKFLTDKGAA